MEYKIEKYLEEGLLLLSKLISYKTVLDHLTPKRMLPLGKKISMP